MSTQAERPAAVQIEVDKAFKKVTSASANSWLYSGNPYYYLMNLNEDRLLEFMLQQEQAESEFCVLDVGCSTSQWGDNAMWVLSSAGMENPIRIFSVTGGSECEEATTTVGTVTHHVFNNFKIENTDEELARRGHGGVKFQLIVSNWALRHLADPVGTLRRLYSLLSPGQGMLMSNGFLLSLEDSPEKILGFPGYRMENWDLVLGDKAVALFRPMNVGRDVGQFLILHSGDFWDSPLEYTGEVVRLPWGYQCESNVTTVFTRASATRGSKLVLTPGPGFDDCVFCDGANQMSKELYARLEALFNPFK
jgi:2-polyprenyl-3-methyl-5-hydroxy-6-metoxy-1,4-benzoquinol methylase